MIKQQIQEILQKEMNRKNFLQYSGGIFLGLIGVTGIIKLLLNETSTTSKAGKKAAGYGSSTYGS